MFVLFALRTTERTSAGNAQCELNAILNFFLLPALTRVEAMSNAITTKETMNPNLRRVFNL